MNCGRCGGVLKVVRREHRYIECGLPSVTLHGVQVRECKACGDEEVAIPNLSGLHRCIAAGIVERTSALAAPEIRFLRQFLGHSSKDFAKILGVAAETFSRWQTGARKIDPSADRLIRLLVLRTPPRTDYSEDMLAGITPNPPKHPKMSLRLRGNAWEAVAA